MATPRLDAAFRATCYRVDCAAGEFDLRIGVVNQRFDDFLRACGARRWGLVTAHNPGGTLVSEARNAALAQALLRRVERLGWRWLPACNLADGGGWPAEPSVLILGVGEVELCALAAEFAQAAIVCGKVGGAPRLVWLSPASCQ